MGAGIRTASANPSGATVVNGQVTFSWQGNVFTITNSPNAIINWDSFSIAPGEMTRFLQQSSNSAVLNRITGQSPSQILGALQSNGRVFLINPNGIIFGAGAQVNVPGLVASTLNMTNADFLAGKNNFTAGNVAGNVTNQGTITTPSGGQVFLIAPNVTNTGIITSPEGEVLLAAGHSVQLADSTNPSLHVVVSSPTDQAINLGQVIAQGGKIGIYGALVNQRGAVNANSAVVGENGKIVLRASGTTLLEAGSTTTATSIDGGGEVQALGQQVGLTGNAQVDASGQNGGGTVLIGGDYQGKNPDVMNAQQVYIDPNASIFADAIVRGNGGKVIVWSDQATRAYGTISARGGAQSGNGGFVETSGHYLDIAGLRVKAGAANGKAGEWLLDPLNISVSDNNDPASLITVSTFAFNPDQMDPNATSFITASQISHTDTNVTLQARNNIDFDTAISITGNFGLSAQAGNNINVNASIATNGGALLLSANDNGGGTASGSGRVNLNNGSTLATNGGLLTRRDSTTIAPPPSADICTIAPNSALCQVLSPPTASEPVKPVQQATNEIIKTVTTSTPKTDFDQVAFLDTKKTTSDSGSGGGATTGSASAGSTPDDSKTDKAADKTDTKEVASTDKSGVKNDPVKKMYCN
ncbi:filamentous hemagglutinin N-terminal domain-containing protein [Oxalobacteraceae bacterium CAVE-383]|nr:filamentous hemagglutinin N-terminal domain-containing protein [Oxalobacteraceae bacterium CAVE-383]